MEKIVHKDPGMERKSSLPSRQNAVLCYVDRTSQISTLEDYVAVEKKKIYFACGDRRVDYPAGIVKRFAKYSLGSLNKIEPFIKISDFFDSNDE